MLLFRNFEEEVQQKTTLSKPTKTATLLTKGWRFLCVPINDKGAGGLVVAGLPLLPSALAVVHVDFDQGAGYSFVDILDQLNTQWVH